MDDLELYFRYKCEKGLKAKGLANKQEYIERLKFEIDTILKMGFPGYFLIVQDFMNWARENNILVGPGRGSAAGSLVSYCLGITNLDPIKWDLLFERFLNPDRISMPDIDIDIEKRFRDRVIEYVMEKYGHDRVAHIGTFNMMRAKAAVRSVCRTLGHPYAIGDELSKLLLPPIHGKPQPLEASIQKVAEVHSYMNNGGTHAEILKWAMKVEDLISSLGVHASGVVISNSPLAETVPLFLGKGGELATQWEMNNIEEAGLIKFDFLGLDALTKVHRCIDIVKRTRDIEIDIDDIDIEDEEVFTKLRAGDNVGIFQLEASSGMKDLLVQIRPTSVEDLIALVAIYRPGPLTSDYKNVYLDVRAGRREPEYLVPELEPILSRTSGWLIYQEQIMEIAKKLAGYTGGEADELRKAVGKKKKALMDKHEPKFKEGWQKYGLSEETARQLWDDMVGFAAYGFNRSHAAAYAMITYQTAWLKTHFPVEFMCAVMISEGGDKDDMIKCLAECKRLGIEVKPPNINKSWDSFFVDDDSSIRFGLGPVKNLGESPVQLVIQERNVNGPFKSLKDFCERIDLGVVNRLKLESLIKAGAFDGFGENRASLLAAIEPIWEYRKQTKAFEKKLETYHRKIQDCEQRLIDIAEGKVSDTGKALKPLKEPERPEPPVYPELIAIDEMPIEELLAYEHELLGFYVSAHPLDDLADTDYATFFNVIDDTKNMPAKADVSIAVVITNKNEITTRKKKKMAFLSLEDLTGSIEAVCFPNVYDKFRTILDETRPVRVDATVEVTEADEGRVTKLVVRNLSLLDMTAQQTPRRIDVSVDAMRARDLTDTLHKYAGDQHEVKVSLKLQDGTEVRLDRSLKIGPHKGAFERDIVRINDGTEDT